LPPPLPVVEAFRRGLGIFTGWRPGCASTALTRAGKTGALAGGDCRARDFCSAREACCALLPPFLGIRAECEPRRAAEGARHFVVSARCVEDAMALAASRDDSGRSASRPRLTTESSLTSVSSLSLTGTSDVKDAFWVASGCSFPGQAGVVMAVAVDLSCKHGSWLLASRPEEVCVKSPSQEMPPRRCLGEGSGEVSEPKRTLC
jgi:hypothetical protein